MASPGRPRSCKLARERVPSERLLTWLPGRGLSPHSGEDGPPLIADSWLVADGQVRGLDLHRRRFCGGCVEQGDVSPRELNAFWQEAVRALPRRGRWFPRVELGSATRRELRLRIRPAPPQGAALRLWTWDGPDVRTAPRLKGPDFVRLAEVRRRAIAAGADEALLTTASGLVLETTTCSLVWWEESSLCLPSPALAVLPGVTARLLQDIARKLRTPIRHRRRRVADLDGREVWLVNALHGIRPVSRWVAATTAAGPAVRAPEWQLRLAACVERLPGRPSRG